MYGDTVMWKIVDSWEFGHFKLTGGLRTCIQYFFMANRADMTYYKSRNGLENRLANELTQFN